MKGYKNQIGKVTSIEDDSIHIDGDLFLSDRSYSKERVARANLRIGDEVTFNFNEKTGEIIYLQNKTKRTGKKVRSCLSSNEYGGPFGGGGEMANLTLESHDLYDEWADGDTM
jgi:hypothetical protein